MSATVPAHLVPNGKPVPHAIPFPSRAAADNAAWQRQSERVAELVKSARKDGFDQGVRAGYKQGVHWGLACGAVAGALAVACLWVGWALAASPALAALGLL